MSKRPPPSRRSGFGRDQGREDDVELVQQFDVHSTRSPMEGAAARRGCGYLEVRLTRICRASHRFESLHAKIGKLTLENDLYERSPVKRHRVSVRRQPDADLLNAEGVEIVVSTSPR